MLYAVMGRVYKSPNRLANRHAPMGHGHRSSHGVVQEIELMGRAIGKEEASVKRVEGGDG